MSNLRPIPRLPAAARKAGATKVQRCVGRDHFAVSYTPGTVDAAVAALSKHFASRGVTVSPTDEGMAIVLEVTA